MKIKPQLLFGVIALLAIAIVALMLDSLEIAAVCATGIVAAVKLLAEADS